MSTCFVPGSGTGDPMVRANENLCALPYMIRYSHGFWSVHEMFFPTLGTHLSTLFSDNHVNRYQKACTSLARKIHGVSVASKNGCLLEPSPALPIRIPRRISFKTTPENHDRSSSFGDYHHLFLVGGLNPSEKYEFVNWDD